MSAEVERAPTKCIRRTRPQLDQLDQQILDVLAEDHPQSVRHVYYRMTNPRLAEPVEKSQRGYRHVQDRMVKLRRTRQLPYHWVTDATRAGFFVNTFSNCSDFLLRTADLYRANPWADADCRCEVWVESRSIAGVIRDDCRELTVGLCPSGGFASLSFLFDAAELINQEDDGRPLHIFYVGDYDPAGVLIDKEIERGIREHLAPDVEMRFERIGITAEQVTQYDLPTKPRNPNDRRATHITQTVEAEAMPAATLRRLLRDRIEDLLPTNALQMAKAAEISERQGLMQLANLCGGVH